MLSIILPSYNEEKNIANTEKVLRELLEQEQIPYELVFVSDGSKDETFVQIQKAAETNPHVKGAEFSRNFGKEAAIFAGLQLAEGDACIVMDCDLQHPPQVIPKMYELWQQGYEVVEGIKISRGRESLAGRGSGPALPVLSMEKRPLKGETIHGRKRHPLQPVLRSPDAAQRRELRPRLLQPG